MGRFAAVYDIVGGEQMVVSVIAPEGQTPHFQIITEVYDRQVSIDLPVVDEEKAKNMTPQEIKDVGVSYLGHMTIENLLEIRRVMVLELKKQQSPAYLRKIADEQIKIEQ